MKILILTNPVESHVKPFIHLISALSDIFPTTIYTKESLTHLLKGKMLSVKTYDLFFMNNVFQEIKHYDTEIKVVADKISQVPTNDMRASDLFEVIYLLQWRKSKIYLKNLSDDFNSFDLIIYDYYLNLGHLISEMYNKKTITLFPVLSPFPPFDDRNIQDFFSINSIGNGYDSDHLLKMANNMKEVSKRITKICGYSFDFFSSKFSEYNIISTSSLLYPHKISDFYNDKVLFIGSETNVAPTINHHNNKKSELNILVNLGETWSYCGKELWLSILNTLGNTKYNIDAATRNLNKWTDVEVYETSDNITCHSHIPFNEYFMKSALYICHGGLSGIHEAIIYEVPILVIPTSKERQINAEQVERLQIGKYIQPTPEIIHEQLLTTIDDLLTNKNLRLNLKKIKESLLDNEGQINLVIDKIINM